MSDANGTPGEPVITFEAFGVRGSVEADSRDLLERARNVLPPGWQPCQPELVEHRFALVTREVGTYAYTYQGEVINQGLDLELAVGILDSQLRLIIGTKAPGLIFIHAGVVAHRGRTLVIPGSSFAGKTTLVTALVRLGAVYFSDEFAVIDNNGLIHPYARPLSLRSDGGGYKQIDHSVESLGGIKGDVALPVGVVAVTSYQPGATWKPDRLSQGEGAMEMLLHAVPARERPAEVLSAVASALKDAVVLRGDRGEADAVARLLLAELERLGG